MNAAPTARRPAPARPAPTRNLIPHIEPLEPRQLLAAVPIPLISFVNNEALRNNFTVNAGTAVFLDGTNSLLSYGLPFNAHYDWDFGDTTPASRFNTLSGFNAAHVYDTPGTYTVHLTVTNAKGLQATATATVLVKPDTRAPIYVAPSGNDANPGDSPDSPIATAARAQQMLASLGGHADIYFQRGGTYDVPQEFEATYPDVVITAYGDAAADPVLSWSGALDSSAIINTASPAAKGVTIRGLTFLVPGHQSDTDKTVVAVRAGGKAITVSDCRFIDVSDGVNANGLPAGLLVLDNTVASDTYLRGYFIWGQGKDNVYLGNVVTNSTREHTIRIAGFYRSFLIAYNSLTNVDHRPDGDPIDYPKSCINCQAGNLVYVAHNALTNGNLNIGPLPGLEGGRFGDYTANAVVEDNLLTGAGIYILAGTSHVAVRGNQVRRDGAPAIYADGYDTFYQRDVEDLAVTNNAAMNASTIGDFLQINGPVPDGYGGPGLILNNNFYNAPNLVGGPYGTAVLYLNIPSLASTFRSLSNNIWSLSQPQSWPWGGDMFVNGGLNGDPNLPFATAKQWTASPMGATDQFIKVTLLDGYLITANGVTAGAPNPGTPDPLLVLPITIG